MTPLLASLPESQPAHLCVRFFHVKVIENQKTRSQHFDDETDMVDAFVACGGNLDKTGHVKRYEPYYTYISLVLRLEQLIRKQVEYKKSRLNSKITL